MEMFFFMVTGFFLSDQKEEGILRQAWSHFKLYALYFPLFSIFTLLRAWALDLQGLAPMKEVIGEQMTLINFFNGAFPALHLWYLLAGALALWLFYSSIERQIYSLYKSELLPCFLASL